MSMFIVISYSPTASQSEVGSVPFRLELVLLNKRMTKWLKIAEDHHWKYKAIRIQTQFCEAVDLLSQPFENVEAARAFLAAIEGYNISFQAFVSSILNSAYKKRIDMCTAAVRANFNFAIDGDRVGALQLASELLKQIFEDVSMKDNHTVYSTLLFFSAVGRLKRHDLHVEMRLSLRFIIKVLFVFGECLSNHLFLFYLTFF